MNRVLHYLTQWFITPIRYFLKLVNDGKIAELLEKEKLQATPSAL